MKSSCCNAAAAAEEEEEEEEEEEVGHLAFFMLGMLFQASRHVVGHENTQR